MCGIGGILGASGTLEELRHRLSALRSALSHRGPDADGSFVAETLDCGFVHTRLAILGLAPTGRQPMATADGRFWITFNGEIYNFRQLRQELEARGCRFHSETDTEVILQLFRLDGPSCVNRLEGMFAFVIWDTVERTAFAARDPFGIKPFYYSLGSSREFAFASELKALIQIKAGPHHLCMEAVLGYLLTGSVPEPNTLVEGIRCLPAGHSLVWKEGTYRLEKYWEATFPKADCSWDEAVGRAREALEASVRRHFVSDVPVGVFLSGGLDSTALVALASRIGTRDLRTFCLRFDEPTFDESEVALRTARHFGYSFETWRLDANAARPVLGEYLSAMDQPSIDGFNTFCVARHAHHSGMKVVLSGLGGDELFGGYASFRRIPQLMRAMEILEGLGLRKTAVRFLKNATGPRRRVVAALGEAPDWGIAHWAMRGIFTPLEALAIAKGFHRGDTSLPSADGLTQNQKVAYETPAPSSKDWVCRLEFDRYLRNQLLRDSDIYSMAWAMELRVPFVDRTLFDSISNIPARHRLASGKKLLQAAVPELPQWVTGRRKQGFVVPFSKWALTEWNQQLGASEATSAVPLSTWYQRWALFALDQFVRRHGLQPTG
jgi:asparagine synthase (glutamine-hydrolysing)